VTVLDWSPARCDDEDDFVSMEPWQESADTGFDPAEQRKRYLQVLRDQVRLAPPTLALPVRPVIGRAQFAVVPEDVKAKVPPNTRTRKPTGTNSS
jgi:hypothetical protein